MCFLWGTNWIYIYYSVGNQSWSIHLSFFIVETLIFLEIGTHILRHQMNLQANKWFRISDPPWSRCLWEAKFCCWKRSDRVLWNSKILCRNHRTVSWQTLIWSIHTYPVSLDQRYYFHLVHVLVRSRDSVVCIATSYGLDDRGFGVRVPMGSRIEVHSTSYPITTGGSFLWGKAPGTWSWPLTSN
jgi:hypothetical protein